MRANKWFMVGVLLCVPCILPLALAEEAKRLNPKVAELMERLKKDTDAIDANIPGTASAEEKVSLVANHQKLQAFIKDKLVPLAVNPVFVAETKAQNAQKVSLDKIKEIDKQWIAAEQELPIQKEKLNNVCAQEVKRVAKLLGVIGETFVMDNQGANVGQNALTSDYWQGDEAKWIDSYKQGKGAIVISARRLDKSVNAVDQKVSVPIIDEDGTVIGAICVGVYPEKL